MKYKNKVTGAILDTPCECKGKDWEELSPSPKNEKVEDEKPKRTKK